MGDYHQSLEGVPKIKIKFLELLNIGIARTNLEKPSDSRRYFIFNLLYASLH